MQFVLVQRFVRKALSSFKLTSHVLYSHLGLGLRSVYTRNAVEILLCYTHILTVHSEYTHHKFPTLKTPQYTVSSPTRQLRYTHLTHSAYADNTLVSHIALNMHSLDALLSLSKVLKIRLMARVYTLGSMIPFFS